jgi:hypothetical protein
MFGNFKNIIMKYNNLDNIILPGGIEEVPPPEGYENQGGIYVPPMEEVSGEVVYPTGQDMDKYIPKKEEKQFTQEQLHYLASSLDFFDLKLKKYKIDSPIKEIKENLKKKESFTFLKYNKWDEDILPQEIPKNYYDCLEDLVSFIVDLTKDIQEVSNFFKQVNILNETQIYAHRCYKLDNPKCFESIVEKLVENNIIFSNEVCNFLSYFVIPDNVKKIILDHIPEESFHPLKDYLKLFVDNEKQGEEEIENIGIEIEGVP